MRLLALDIPDDLNERAQWLEQQLVGLELRELVISLVGLQEEQPEPVSLEELLADKLPAILDQGLRQQDSETIQKLLSHPASLLDLQERIFIDGGAYWETVERIQEHKQATDQQWERIVSASGSAPNVSVQPEFGKPTSARTMRLLLAVAAAVLVGISLLMNRPEPAPQGWGFNRPGTLTQQMPAEKYLTHLGDAANEWFNKRPEEKEALELRLTQFINGCQALIDAPHPQLRGEDRDWLRERCGVWKEKLEEQRTDLVAGTKSVTEVRNESDTIINQLIDALRTRSESVS